MVHSRTTMSEQNGTDSLPHIRQGRNHGKVYKDWHQPVRETDITPSEFDACESEMADTRAIRRAIAQDGEA